MDESDMERRNICIDQPTRHEIVNMKIAVNIASLSHCVAHKVGCIITRNDRIISTGYNGTVAGAKNCDDIFVENKDGHSAWSRINEIHAEMNALLVAAKNGISTNNCTLYTTLSPCPDCVKNIAQAGISRIIYMNEYDKSQPDWISKCKSYGIKVSKITLDTDS